MIVRFSQEGGWSGGQWKFDGLTRTAFIKLYGFDPWPVKGVQGDVINHAGQHRVVCSEQTLTVRGVDHDHGHEYPWKYEEPMFLVGNCPFPIPASQIWKDGYTIMLEVS